MKRQSQGSKDHPDQNRATGIQAKIQLDFLNHAAFLRSGLRFRKSTLILSDRIADQGIADLRCVIYASERG